MKTKTAAVVVPAVVVAPRLPDRVRDRLRGIIALKLTVPALESEVARLREALQACIDSDAHSAGHVCSCLACVNARNVLAEGGHK